MTHLLSICHSAGDSNVIKETALELAKNQIHTTILVVGAAARGNIESLLKSLKEDKQNNLADFISMMDLDEILSDAKPIRENRLQLKEHEIEEIAETLNIPQFDALLVGTPSYVQVEAQSQIPEQLLAEFSKMLRSAVASDYAFYDPQHRLATHRWFKMAEKFFIPFEGARTAFGLQEAGEKIAVVGHPSIDATKKLYDGWIPEEPTAENPDPKRNAIYAKLNLKPEQKFIFVAGGKAGDEAIIRALSITCQTFPEIQIILGMHPAATPDYLDSIRKIIAENKAESQIKFMNEGIAEREKRTTTDEAVYAAAGVMTVSSTVGTQAAACNKPVAFYQEGVSGNSVTKPYIVVENEKAVFCTQPAQLLPFYQAVVENARLMRKEDVAIRETAAEKIAHEIEGLMKKPKLT